MTASFAQLLLALLAGIGLIIVLTVRYRVHAFPALFLACLVVGLGVEMAPMDIIQTMKKGFGHIMQSLGLVIVLGTFLGSIMEHNGSTRVMAAAILRLVGEKRAATAMGITGFIVGLPIFCDSGYIVLSGLNRSVARRSGVSIVVLSVSLASGLYAVHCLIPPHPGATAAGSIIGGSMGMHILIGTLVAIPAALAGCAWARYMGKKTPTSDESFVDEEQEELPAMAPWKAFLPIIVPIALIGAGAFSGLEGGNAVLKILGEPVIALSIGVTLALATSTGRRHAMGRLMSEAAEKAGGILVIIGAGGAFGAILATTNIGEHLQQALPLSSLGLLFPFLLTFVLKTAQGSSTVAIITAASIVAPLMGALELDSENGKLLCLLAMGGGSMMVSHGNDAYFWVISKFSAIDMRPMLKVYSVATIIMGLTTFFVVWLLSLFML